MSSQGPLEPLWGDDNILDDSLCVLLVEASSIHTRSDSIPLSGLQILCEPPFLQLSLVLGFAVDIVKDLRDMCGIKCYSPGDKEMLFLKKLPDSFE